MLNRTISIFFLMVLLMANSACAATFQGTVVDADTGQPIEGAVVVAHWNEGSATIAGEDTRLKDIKETLTDENGEWEITGPAGQEGSDTTSIRTFVTSTYYTRLPEFVIFKPGYCSIPDGFFVEACKDRIDVSEVTEKDIGHGETIGLPKLSEREDRLKVLPSPIGEMKDRKKQKEFIKTINEESRLLGIGEYKLPK